MCTPGALFVLYSPCKPILFRKYLPELKRLPLKYLFEPWKAPLKVQKAARCIVGDDYPEPVANHTEQRKICVQRLKDLCISLDISGTSSIIVHFYRVFLCILHLFSAFTVLNTSTVTFLFPKQNSYMSFTSTAHVYNVFFIQVIKVFIGSERTFAFTTIPVCVKPLQTVRCSMESTSWSVVMKITWLSVQTAGSSYYSHFKTSTEVSLSVAHVFLC